MVSITVGPRKDQEVLGGETAADSEEWFKVVKATPKSETPIANREPNYLVFLQKTRHTALESRIA
jgi:hypothetical protein